MAEVATSCRHALRESGCRNCAGLDPDRAPVRRFCDGRFRHAVKEAWCPNCQGIEPSPVVTKHRPPSLREQVIRAASDEVKAAIKSWRSQWRSLRSVICHWCKQTFAPDECHADHVIPLSRGGPHDLSNLVIACATCNFRKNARMPEVWAGLIAGT